MELLKLIICTIVLLGFVATIMRACNAWNTRIFIIYVATAIIAITGCMLLDN